MATLCAAMDGQDRLVQRGDTLWMLGGRLAGEIGVTREQAMLALLERNPDAVSTPCNVNGTLRVGARLQWPLQPWASLPDETAARRIIAQHARDWDAQRQLGQPLTCPPVLEETARPPATSPPVSAEPQSLQDGLPAEEPATLRQAADPGLPDGPPAPPILPVLDHHEGIDGPLPSGPSAPLWLLALLVLALVAAAHLGRVRHRPAVVLPLSGAAPPVSRHRAVMQAFRSGQLALLLAAALAGFLGALVTVIFREGILLLEWLLVGQSGSLVAMAHALTPWQRLLIPALGGLLAGLILTRIGARLRGRTTTDYMESVTQGDGWISVRHSLVKSASSLVTVASGGSIGREGAMVQLAAMMASVIGRLARFPRERLRLLVAAGAAAGLAAAYNAPIAATIFVAEIVLGSIAIEFIGPLIVAAVIANVTVHDLMGYAPVYDIPAFHLVSDGELLLYLLLGLIAGHVAPVFLNLLARSHRLFARLPVPLAGRMMLGGLIVGLISVYEPAVWGNGYSVVSTVLNEPWVWQALLTVLVLKIISTAATHGSGAIGGAFTPTLFVGALLGALFGTLVQVLIPDGTGPASAYAVVGMGAMLAGTTHAPLMAILMVFEMTMDYAIVLPLMLAVVTAHYTARRYADIAPMYADSLLPREHDPADSSVPRDPSGAIGEARRPVGQQPSSSPVHHPG
nr:ClcB-like voltage-gated chloride channel protein [Thiocapsa imhoffii]